MGDFNGNRLDCSSPTDRNVFGSVKLTQLINEPTRVDYWTSSLLDWILVTNPERIDTFGVMADCLSDHSVIFCLENSNLSSPKNVRLRQCKHINVDCVIQSLIASNWDIFQLIPFVDDAWKLINMLL